jgi:hypothetical protein
MRHWQQPVTPEIRFVIRSELALRLCVLNKHCEYCLPLLYFQLALLVL